MNQGEQGIRGEQGKPGDKGAMGDKGTRGEQGPKGVSGVLLHATIPRMLVLVLLVVGLIVTNHQGREEVIQHAFASCQRGIQERLVSIQETNDAIREEDAGIVGNRAVASDPRQPPETKRARNAQAAREEEVRTRRYIRREQRYMRVDARHGGRSGYDCRKLNPKPAWISL